MDMEHEFEEPIRITSYQYNEALGKLPPVPNHNQMYNPMNRYKVAVIDFEEERKTRFAWENDEDEMFARSVPVIELEFEVVRSGMEFFWQCTRPVLLIPALMYG